jgi:hypothetical protein
MEWLILNTIRYVVLMLLIVVAVTDKRSRMLRGIAIYGMIALLFMNIVLDVSLQVWCK